MLKRKAEALIKNWINSKEKKCLVVHGARQTGKTYIIERFAEDNYDELVEINFKQTPSASQIFSGDLTVENMVMSMRFRFPEKKIAPKTTLIFLDEISLKQHIVENTLSGNSKGGIYECTVTDALYKKGYRLYFYQ